MNWNQIWKKALVTSSRHWWSRSSKRYRTKNFSYHKIKKNEFMSIFKWFQIDRFFHLNVCNNKGIESNLQFVFFWWIKLTKFIFKLIHVQISWFNYHRLLTDQKYMYLYPWWVCDKFIFRRLINRRQSCGRFNFDCLPKTLTISFFFFFFSFCLVHLDEIHWVLLNFPFTD